MAFAFPTPGKAAAWGVFLAGLLDVPWAAAESQSSFTPVYVNETLTLDFADREAFEGQGHERKMTFDYHLRPGIASTTNALELLDMVGLTGDESATDSSAS